MKTTANFTFGKVLFSQDNKNHLVVSLEAPKVDKKDKRGPICVIPVIDVSPSMAGKKMEYAKKSVLKLLDHLQPGDFCGLISFDGLVHEIAKPSELTQTKKDKLKAEVGKFNSSGGGTNISDAMLKAVEFGNNLDVSAEMPIRIIILTDGQPNMGCAKVPKDILALAKKSRGRVSISAFGYGEDCDQEFLASLATQSEGNYAFIKNPDDALTAFGKELGGLLSVYAQNIVVEVTPTNGHEIEDVLSDVDVEENDKSVSIKLSDILSEERRDLVLAVNLSEQKQALPRSVNVFDITVRYEQVKEGKRETNTDEVKAKVQFVKDGDQDTKADEKLDTVVALAEMVQAQIEAEELAQKGDFNAAAGLLRSVGASFGARGQSVIATQSNNLAGSYGTYASYSTSAGYRTSSKGLATRAFTVSSSDPTAQEQFIGTLSAGGLSLNNSSQEEGIDSFADTSAVAGNNLPSIAGTIGGSADSPFNSAIAQVVKQIKADDAKSASKSGKGKSRSKRW